MNADTNFLSMTFHGKWNVEFCSDKGVYQVTHEKYPDEVYEFKTKEYADAQAKFCNNTLPGYPIKTYYLKSSYEVAVGDLNSSWHSSFRVVSTNGKVVVDIKNDGTIIAFDLPQFVLGWVKSTKTYKVVRTGLIKFWYGERNAKSRLRSQ